MTWSRKARVMKTSSSTASDPFAVALRLLTHSDCSTARLREKLQRRGFAAAQIDAAIARCQHYDYLNDRRYAALRARTLMQSGRGVGQRVLLDLRRQGISEEIAHEALAAASEDFEPELLLRQELARRFPDFDYASADQRQRQRVVNFFRRRGFSVAQILTELRQERSFSDI